MQKLISTDRRHPLGPSFGRVLRRSLVAAGLSVSLVALPVDGGPLTRAVQTPAVAAQSDDELVVCPREIRRGDRGRVVARLQSRLNEVVRDFQPIAVDGDFGGQTEGRVYTFQSRANIRQDGVVGLATWRALKMCRGG
jgi:peptidoglycan hydrolase-like protein with peptidoglycan-binding domain